MDEKTIARRKLLESELDRYVKILVKEEQPEKIIIFGSLATGDVYEWSDIDVVVVSKSDLPFFKRLLRMRDMIQPKVGLDLLCYTPEEFEHMAKTRLFFQQAIIPKGQVIYERRN